MATPIDLLALQTLTQWLSPGFPVGAFSFSHGMEWAVESGDVKDGKSAEQWIGAIIEHGAGRNDAIFIAHAYRAANALELKEIDQLALAFCASAERLAETTQLGKAFAKTLEMVWDMENEARAYPVILGRAASLHRIDLSLVIAAYLQSFAANLVACAQRLFPLGQLEGQAIISGFAACIESMTPEIIAASLDDLGGCVFRSDMASMAHENQKVRIFRT